MRTLTIPLVALLSLTGCLGGGGGGRRPAVSVDRPPAAASEARLQGQWELVNLEAQGQPLQAQGRLSFDGDRNIAIRAELAPGEQGATPPRVVVLDFSARASVSGPDQLTYVGVQTRAPQEQMIPTATDPGAWRYFAVDGDTLRVWQVGPDGQPAGVMVFRRVSP